MNKFIDNKKIIFLLSLIFISIIFFLNLFKLIKKTSQMNTLSIHPTSSVTNKKFLTPNKNLSSLIPTETNHYQPQIYQGKNNFQKEILPKIKVFSEKDQIRFNQFIQKLPLTSENSMIYYSSLLNKAYLIAKNDQGKSEIERMIKDNQLEDMVNKYPEILILNENLNEDKIEEETENYQKNMNIENHNLETPSPTSSTSYLNEQQITSSPSVANEPNPFSSLVEILRVFYEMGNIDSYQTTTLSIVPSPFSLSPNPSQTTSYPIPSLFNPQISNYSSFIQLFNEVGSKVGVPPKILAGVMTAESPSTFNLTAEKINLYSTPNNVIENCRPNVCSATGPMQMTIGVDNSGSSQCLKCGLTYCPNAWARYGNAINLFTNADHTTNPCNLLDNIYAAAYKLKTDSGASNPLNWTQEQVYRAGTRYHGSCSDRYRYPRLGNRTYCEFLWWFYTSN